MTRVAFQTEPGSCPADRPDDKAELEAGLQQLSDATVHKRFLAPKRTSPPPSCAT